MKYWFGYLVAVIIGAITWVLQQFGQRFSTLIDMVYPYVMRTVQGFLAQWSGGVDFLLWQVLAVFLVVIILALLAVDRSYIRIGTLLCMILGGPIIDVFTLILAALILQEAFTPKSIFGCVLIGAGTLLMVL